MNKPIIFGFYGYSNSGKTSLIERVIKELTEQGRQISVIKQSGHSVSMDTPGKDTYRFTLAGAGLVVLASESETSIIINKQLPIREIIKINAKINEMDIILVESARDAEFKKIRIGDIALRENTIWTYDGDFNKLINLIKNGGM